MCFVKKVFLEISQNSQENTCARDLCFFNKVAGLGTPFLTEHLWWLFLNDYLVVKFGKRRKSFLDIPLTELSGF